MHETNRNDTQSVLLPEGKRVCVYVSREWLGSLVSVYFCCFSVARSVDIVFFPSYLRVKTLAKPRS